MLFGAKKAGAQRFIVDARTNNRHFLRPPSGPLLTGQGLSHVEFRGALQDAQNWFVGSAVIKNAFHQMRKPIWLQEFCALPAVLTSEAGYTGKMVDQRRLAPDSLVYPVRTTLSIGFSWAIFSVKRSRITARTREVLTLLFSVVVTDHSTPLMLGCENGLGYAGFHWSCADNFGVLARGADCTSVHLARRIAGVQKAGVHVHDMSFASGSADGLAY